MIDLDIKTFGKIIHHKTFPLKIIDKFNDEIYYENSIGYWEKQEYDRMGNDTYWESAHGNWEVHEYNSKGEEIYALDSFGNDLDRL